MITRCPHCPGICTDAMHMAYRQLSEDLARSNRERVRLETELLEQRHRAALAEEERNILRRRVERLMFERAIQEAA